MTGGLHHKPVGDALVPLSRGSELVEDVVVSLLAGLKGDPGLLQKVVLDHTTFDLELRVEADLGKCNVVTKGVYYQLRLFRQTCMNRPNRDELSLRIVLAFPVEDILDDYYKIFVFYATKD